jgi:hypothetical protein
MGLAPVLRKALTSPAWLQGAISMSPGRCLAQMSERAVKGSKSGRNGAGLSGLRVKERKSTDLPLKNAGNRRLAVVAVAIGHVLLLH